MIEDKNSLEIRGCDQYLCGFKKPPNLLAWELFAIETAQGKAEWTCDDYLTKNQEVLSVAVIYKGTIVYQKNKKEINHD